MTTTATNFMKVKAFFLGMWEFMGNSGMTWDDNPYHPLSMAYDTGRDWAHALTFRHWDY